VTETLDYTGLVADINSGTGSSYPSGGVTIGTTYFFSANDGTHGTELWQRDGTAAGTVMVKDIIAGAGNSSPQNLIVMANTLFFIADDGTNGTEPTVRNCGRAWHDGRHRTGQRHPAR
jgi:ELWxxDGT repeat protein